MSRSDVIDPSSMGGGRTFLSLYSGAGGLDLGFVRAGLKPVWANDFEPNAVATYNALFGDLVSGHEATQGDIHELLRAGRVPGRNAADLVIGGPPCQGFSVAGKMDPDDPRSRHVWTFLEIVRRVQPGAWVLENVSSLAWNRRWSALLDALRRKAERKLGYRTTLLVLNASHFGVPQNRRRMFLVGTRDGDLVEPLPTTSQSPPTVRNVLERLPRPGEPGNDTPCKAKITPARRPVLRRSPFAGMLFNGKGRPLNLDAPAPTLPASMGGNKTPIIDQEQLETGARCWVIGYHAHLLAGGQPYRAIPERLRRLTVQEAAAIQTFPSDMRWAGSTNQQFAQIGNAVPPELAYHVALAVMEALGSTRDAKAPERAAVA